MNSLRKYSCYLCFCTFLSACSPPEVSQPSCRVDASSQAKQSGAGACIIVVGGNLLVNENSQGKLQLSIGEEEIQQSAQCAAHKAVFRDTGFNVQVQHSLGIQEDGTWLFSCQLEAGFDGTEDAFDPAFSEASDIEKLLFINPFLIEIDQWQHPDTFIAVRDAYVREKQEK